MIEPQITVQREIFDSLSFANIQPPPLPCLHATPDRSILGAAKKLPLLFERKTAKR